MVPVALALTAILGLGEALRTPALATGRDTAVAPATAVLSPRRVPTLLADAIADGNLRSSLDRALSDPDLGGGSTNSCLIVRDKSTTLYAKNPNLLATPASTLKLLTAAAVLLKLDPNSHLTTRAVARTAPADGVVNGDLFLVGAGDPLLATADYEASFKDQPRRFTDLNLLADNVVKAGVHSITGAVLGDESRYDTQRYVPTWKPVYASDGDVGPLSALMFNDDFTAWKPKALAAPSPAEHAAGALTDMLKARGVSVGAAPAEGTAPSSARPVASLDSLPIRDLVGEMLVHSDNESAELLTKELGRRFGGAGTTTAGVQVIRRTLSGAGIDMRPVTASDGSGLAASDKVTCNVLESVLTSKSRTSILGAGLSVAGQTGTMFDHFKNGNPANGRLRGKTGTLEGVVGLAGIVDPVAPNTDGLTFAFLAGSLPTPSEARGKAVLDRLGAALAAYPHAPDAASLGP